MSQSSTYMLCSTFVSAKIRHGNLKTSVFNFCGSMLPGFADFNAKNNKKNLHGCNEYMNNDELRNTLKFSQLSRYANKQATTKLPRYTQSVAWLHSVHLLCTRQSVNGAYRDHYTNNLNKLSYGKNKRCSLGSWAKGADGKKSIWILLNHLRMATKPIQVVVILSMMM